MPTLLYIEASPRGEHSYSTRVAHHFLESYAAHHPGTEVDHLNLWETELPAFNGYVQQAKYALLHGKPYTPEQAAAWKAIEAVIERFKKGDKFLFSVPMWNYGIPYILKHYLDVILQPRYTFEVTPEGGYRGLIPNKPAAVIFARGGSYLPGSGHEAIDFQAPYLLHALRYIGIAEPAAIYIEETGGPQAAEKLTRARLAADALASTF